MPTTLPKRNRGAYGNSAGEARESGLSATTLFVTSLLALLAAALPAPLVLPAFGVLIMLSGLLLGAWTLLRRWRHGPANERMLDLAGLLLLFGAAAAIVCDKDEMLQLLSAMPAP